MPSGLLIQQRAAMVYNVKDYGATGNGTTDDTATVQATINAATAGGTIYFPPGTYRITATLTVTVAGVRLAGAGRQATVISIDTGLTPSGVNTGTVLGGAITFTQADYCGIEHLTIRGANTSTVTSNANVSAVQVIASRWFHFQSMQFSWINGYGPEVLGSASLSPNASFYCTANDLRMDNSLAGAHLNSVSAGGYGCQARWSNINVGTNIGPTDGFFIEDCNDVLLTNYEGPLHIYGGSAISVASFDCSAISSSAACILIEQSANTGPTRIELAAGETTNGAIGIHVGAGVGSVTITGVQFSGYTSYGLEMDSGTVIVAGCEFNTTAGVGTGAYDIYSNTFHTNNVVSGCVFTSAIGTTSGHVQSPVNIAQRDFTTWIGNIFANGSATTTFTGANPPRLAANNQGYNPVGSVTVSVGASPYTIPSKGYAVEYYITGGTVSQISVGGVNTNLTGGTVRVPPQQSCIITYTSAPTVTGYAD